MHGAQAPFPGTNLFLDLHVRWGSRALPFRPRRRTLVRATADSVVDEDDDVDDDDDAAARASPPPSSSTDFEGSFAALLGLSADDVPAVFGPRSYQATKRWAGPSATSVFRHLRRDPCLLPNFDKFVKSDKAFFDLASTMMAKSGAASHAVLYASSYIERFLVGLRDVSADPEWPSTCDKIDKAMKECVLSPLRDSSLCLAEAFGRALSGVRTGVLRTSPLPSSRCCARHPLPADSSSLMNLAVMESIVHRLPISRGAPTRRPAYSAAPAPAPAAASTSSRSLTRGKASARSSRGGRGGRRK